MDPTTNLRYLIAPGGVFEGRLRVPGDKSISHRSIMLSAIADGVTRISGFLEGADALATLAAFRRMGVEIEGPTQGELSVHGVGLRGLTQSEGPLDMGNSGTAMRLLAGLLAGQTFPSTLIGDESLTRRPMRRVTAPLAQMGAQILTTADGTAPLRVEPVSGLRGIEYPLPMASAQVKSCLMLAGLYAQGETCIIETAPTRDHTERMLTAFGYSVRRAGARVCLTGGGRLLGCRLNIPADISSAAFFMVGASIAPGSDLLLENVGINPTRVGIINILRGMGANIELIDRRTAGGEPVADIRVKAARLRGIHIPVDQVPLAIDEFPAIFIAAACAEGETILTGAEELRVKESDRIQVMADGLVQLGIQAEPRPDGIRILGGQIGSTDGGSIHAQGDHRIAMSFAMAGLRAEGPIEVHDCANVETSFPGFPGLAAQAGLKIQEQAA
ncbi:3-phosphoshikimate 1-carboxyvinyltransferase [Thiocystis violacea]|uniref:3-phosphoshikimate 1-carboxyvinyltransferase n=1 Tax=Thiocystis violacea TaxID=13725 RepID=UPI00190577DC|nr:3-phosphoshikimate 1-carboxyvinyltransferase [Thiocystis violacea]MBK1720684.1 3-phosphoshikimate 1-carboxyvinyltransferase [Thiocystis violacea]